MKIAPSRWNPHFVALLLFAVSFVLRSSLISVGPYHIDCLILSQAAQKTFETGHLSFALGFGYPAMVMMGAFMISVFHVMGIHDPVLAMNFISVVSSSIAVGMLYLLTKRLLDDQRTAFLSAFLFCISPIFLATSVYGMNHAPAVCFLLTSLYFLFGYFKSEQLKDLLWSAVFLGCMGATRTQDMALVVPAIAVAFMLSRAGGARWAIRFLIYSGTVFLILGLFHFDYLFAASRSGYADQLGLYWQQGLLSNFKGLFSPYLKVALGSNFSLASFLLTLFGLTMLVKRDLKPALFIIVWILVPFVFLGNLLMVRPRFFIVLIPAIMICQAYGLAYFSRKGLLGQWGTGLVIVLLTVMQIGIVWPGLIYRHQNATIVDYARHIGRLTPPNAKLITGDEGAFIVNYASRELLQKPRCNFGCSEESLHEFRHVLDKTLQQRPVYITDIALWADNDGHGFLDFMKAHYDMKLAGRTLYEDWHPDTFWLVVWDSELFWVQPKLPAGR